jgi:hypothetical protein
MQSLIFQFFFAKSYVNILKKYFSLLDSLSSFVPADSKLIKALIETENSTLDLLKNHPDCINYEKYRKALIDCKHVSEQILNFHQTNSNLLKIILLGFLITIWPPTWFIVVPFIMGVLYLSIYISKERKGLLTINKFVLKPLESKLSLINMLLEVENVNILNPLSQIATLLEVESARISQSNWSLN